MKIRRTNVFDKWLKDLKDPGAKSRIYVRIDRLSKGNPGDVKPVGEGVSEMRIDYGNGYRMYYKGTCAPDTGKEIIILLCGGVKATQTANIATAKNMAKIPLEEEED
jgi:putative addiction module killer protein